MTEIYLHVATGVNGLGVVSPLDYVTDLSNDADSIAIWGNCKFQHA